MKFHNYLLIFLLCYIICILYTPEILNTNIEQEVQELSRKYTPQERQFLDYFPADNYSYAFHEVWPWFKCWGYTILSFWI